MIIDCHYHLEESILTVDELIRRMDEAGVDRIALMGSQIGAMREPSTALVGLNLFLLTHRFTRPISRPFIANFTEKGIKILGKEMEISRDPDNGAVFDAVRARPDRFLGWIFVNPAGERDQEEEFRRYCSENGFVGVKAHPFWNHHTPLDLLPVARLCAESGRPLLIHAGFGAEGDFGALLAKVPELTLILAHAGFPGYSDTWKEIFNRKNVYVDLSQTSYVGEKIMKAVIDRLGPERCLFGTDGPYGFHGKDGTFDYGLIKRRIERLVPDAGARRMILGDNFAAIAGIE